MRSTYLTIIGGGAAGLMAAVAAADAGAELLLLEKNPRVGKKLLATGNGRCNYTNTDMMPEHFFGQDPGFAAGPLERLSAPETIELFRRLGVEPKIESGRLFPASDQASSVLDVLRHYLEHRQVQIKCDSAARSITPEANGFIVDTASGPVQTAKIILATGGRAGPQFGCSGDGYALAQAFGHRLVEPFPALVQLRLQAPFLKALSGVKFVGQTSLYEGAQLIGRARGDVLFTDYGVSGPPVLALSRMAGEIMARGGIPHLTINLFPDLTETQIESYLARRFYEQGHKTAEVSLVGYLPKRSIGVLLQQARIDRRAAAADIGRAEISRLARLLANWSFQVIGTRDWASAQVTAGGLDVRDIDGHTLQSRLIEGLYFAGELIDIDGKSGGYNLQWAWSSGYTAALSACESL